MEGQARPLRKRPSIRSARRTPKSVIKSARLIADIPTRLAGDQTCDNKGSEPEDWTKRTYERVSSQCRGNNQHVDGRRQITHLCTRHHARSWQHGCSKHHMLKTTKDGPAACLIDGLTNQNAAPTPRLCLVRPLRRSQASSDQPGPKQTHASYAPWQDNQVSERQTTHQDAKRRHAGC